MSQQINLYEERLRPRRELATGRNLGVLSLIVLLVMAGLSLWMQFDARHKAAAAATVQQQLTVAQQKLTELNKAMAERKVSPALMNEIETAKSLLAQRQEITNLLESGRLGNTVGFSSLMTGFARQSTPDLWLTGFTISMGGEEIEIRGRVLDPVQLPAYVHGLSSEAVFQGRRFAALDVRDVDPNEAKPGTSLVANGSGTNAVAPAQLPRHSEFVLRSENAALQASTATIASGRQP